MNATTHRHYGNGYGSNSKEIERDIERTRQEMDETLDELGERLSPRHLLDELLDMFRSEGTSRGRQYAARQAKSAGKKAASVAGRQLARTAKEHPLPSLLIAAGAAWLVYDEMFAEDEEVDFHSQWADIPEHSGSFVDARTGEPYDESYGRQWRGAAWSKGYDWSQSEHSEQAWTERASQTLDELKSTFADKSLSAKEKLQSTGARLMGLSGAKRRQLHDQWANLREHSGSFVDARTGEPYDDSYIRECEALMGCDFAACHEWSPEDEESWTEKAQHALEDMQETLSDTTASVKDRVAALAGKVGGFVESTRGTASEYAHSLREGAGRVARGTRQGAARMGRQARRGYSASRDYVQEAMDESPLAVGAACLGLGLIAGLLLPHTRQEDRLMGPTSDRLKHRAKETAKEALHRGQHVAQATAGAALDEMERQGLTPSHLGEAAQHAVESAAQTLEEETGGASGVQESVARVAERAMETAKDETQKQASETRQ